MTEFNVRFQILGVGSQLQADLVHTDIFGPRGRRYSLDEDAFELALEPGVYRARVSAAGISLDHLLVVEPAEHQHVDLPLPGRFSAAPLPDAIGHHEYYIATFVERSLTRRPLNEVSDDNEQYLFIYLRMRDREHAADFRNKRGEPPRLFRGLRLLDQAGRCLSRFLDDEVVEAPEIGMARFRAAIRSGYYRLVYTDEQGRTEWLPLPVLQRGCEAWDTDISMLWDDRPRFSSMSLFTPISDRSDALDFAMYQMQTTAIDTVTQVLASGQRTSALQSSTVRQLLHDKFTNPMLGILGLHLYLLRDDPKASIVDTVLENLRNLAPGSPDVEALHVLAAQRGLADAAPSWSFADIPLVRLGARAMQRASLGAGDGEFSLPPHSEQLFMHMQPGSPWSQTGCVTQAALERPEAVDFSADYLNLDAPMAVQFELPGSDTVRHDWQALRTIVVEQGAKAEVERTVLSVKDLNEEDVVPVWLTEAVLNQLPELRVAQKLGKLDEELVSLAVHYELLLPTVRKVALHLLEV